MNTRFTPALLLTGTFVGALLFTQFNTDVPIDSTFPVDELQAREEVLSAFLNEQSYLQSRIVSLREQVEDIQISIEEQSKDANINYLNSMQKEIGLSEVQGSGVEIILDDAPSASRLDVDTLEKNLVQASDLRDVINILFAADAEAISINNQRVIASSPIVSVGTTILVNDTFISPPFVIQAIGSSEDLSQRLYTSLDMKELYSRKNELGLVFEISGRSSIVIPIYNGELPTNYLNLVE